MIEVKLTFVSLYEAIVALGKMVGARGTAKPPAGDAPPATVRKGRADKGHARGPYRHGTENAGASAASDKDVATAGNGTSETTDAGKAAEAATPTSTTSSAPGDAAQPATLSKTAPAPSAPAPVARVPDHKEAQSALEALYNKKGAEVAMGLIASFSIAKLRELPESDRDAFIKKANELTAAA